MKSKHQSKAIKPQGQASVHSTDPPPERRAKIAKSSGQFLLLLAFSIQFLVVDPASNLESYIRSTVGPFMSLRTIAQLTADRFAHSSNTADLAQGANEWTDSILPMLTVMIDEGYDIPMEKYVKFKDEAFKLTTIEQFTDFTERFGSFETEVQKPYHDLQLWTSRKLSLGRWSFAILTAVGFCALAYGELKT